MKKPNHQWKKNYEPTKPPPQKQSTSQLKFSKKKRGKVQRMLSSQANFTYSESYFSHEKK